jgi:hypothetical protein
MYNLKILQWLIVVDKVTQMMTKNMLKIILWKFKVRSPTLNSMLFICIFFFTLLTCYYHAACGWGDWKILWGWNWKGPDCIRNFMRLAADEHILTNARRSKWGVRISPACASCRKDDETIPCVARLCAATWVWIQFVPSNFINYVVAYQW